MATKLEKALKRELEIEGRPYILIIDPGGLKLTEKGRRKGQELAWKDLVSGEAALAAALRASVAPGGGATVRGSDRPTAGGGGETEIE